MGDRFRTLCTVAVTPEVVERCGSSVDATWLKDKEYIFILINFDSKGTLWVQRSPSLSKSWWLFESGFWYFLSLLVCFYVKRQHQISVLPDLFFFPFSLSFRSRINIPASNNHFSVVSELFDYSIATRLTHEAPSLRKWILMSSPHFLTRSLSKMGSGDSKYFCTDVEYRTRFLTSHKS